MNDFAKMVLVAVIAFAVGFGVKWLLGNSDVEQARAEAENACIDKLASREAEWRQRLADHLLEDLRRVADTIRHPVPLKPRPLTPDVQEAALKALQMEKDSLLKFIEDLAIEKFFYDEEGYNFDNDYVSVGINAYGVHYPLSNRTVVQYNANKFSIKNLPKEYIPVKSVIVKEEGLFRGFVLILDGEYRFKDRAMGGGASAGMKFGAGDVLITPRYGYRNVLGTHAGVTVEWVFLR